MPDIKHLIELQQGKERIRQAQQGEGRPIISLKSHDHQMVAVGNTLHWSKTWKTFVDFLSDYMKRKLGSDWGNAEIAKPLAKRHSITLATRRLERYEQKELKEGETAYVFVTNLNFHRDLEGRAQLAAFPFGLGMPDFNRPGFYRMSERYKQDKKHADALKVADGLSKLLRFPSTFDGSLPNVTLKGERPPIIIGERFNFEGAGPDGKDLRGTVADATVVEAEKATYVVVNAENGTSCILKEPMTDGQINDYKAHPDAYFGRVVRPQKRADTPHELFEFFMYAYRELSREELLKKLAGRVPDAAQMPDDELLAIYCEGMISAGGMFKVVGGVRSDLAAKLLAWQKPLA